MDEEEEEEEEEENWKHIERMEDGNWGRDD